MIVHSVIFYNLNVLTKKFREENFMGIANIINHFAEIFASGKSCEGKVGRVKSAVQFYFQAAIKICLLHLARA